VRQTFRCAEYHLTFNYGNNHPAINNLKHRCILHEGILLVARAAHHWLVWSWLTNHNRKKMALFLVVSKSGPLVIYLVFYTKTVIHLNVSENDWYLSPHRWINIKLWQTLTCKKLHLQFALPQNAFSPILFLFWKWKCWLLLGIKTPFLSWPSQEGHAHKSQGLIILRPSMCHMHAGMSCVVEGENRRTRRQPLCQTRIDWNSARDFSQINARLLKLIKSPCFV